MKKWVLSAVAYLVIVVGAYYLYSYLIKVDQPIEHASESHENENETTNGENEEEHGEDHGESHNGHETGGNVESDVVAMLKAEDGELIITLKDQEGNPVSELEVNHEKLLHLIVVTSDLSEYQHLHPETNEAGVFKVAHSLKEGGYKAFIDIKPKDLTYHVEPVPFTIGESHGDHNHASLQPDSDMTKKVGNHTVTLKPSALTVNENIQLTFDLHGETPETYLGALGHVVILDEEANEYIHVHPLEGNEPIFETKMTEPGIYSIWAEFQFKGEVNVFRYIVEIE